MIAVLVSYAVGTLLGKHMGERSGSNKMLAMLVENNFVRTETVEDGFRIVPLDSSDNSN